MNQNTKNTNFEIQMEKERTVSTSTDILNVAKAVEERQIEEIDKLELTIDKIHRDKSEAARQGRRIMAFRAMYGEFMCTFLFFTPIFGCIAKVRSLNASSLASMTLSAFVAGFQAIAVSFAFSSVSGAHFNPAISWALWLTKKLSSRRCAMFISVQFLASIISMTVVACMFRNQSQAIYDACAVTPTDEKFLGEVFATEYFLTFILTYVAFTVVFEDAEVTKKETMSIQTISDSKGLTLYATTPQSKTGFAPFAIGFTIFSLSLIGGESNGAFNPARMLGPAMFSGKWSILPFYWFAQILGSTSAAMLVQLTYYVGLRAKHRIEDVKAIDTIHQVTPNFNKDSTDNMTQNPMKIS